MSTETQTVGRPVSEMTLAIRALLAKHNGDITAKTALPLLKEQGHEVTVGRFNIAKTQWKKGHGKSRKVAVRGQKKGRKPEKAPVPRPRTVPTSTAPSDIGEAMKFVESCGGLSKAKQVLAESEATLKANQAKVAAFEDFQKRFQKAAS